MSDVTPMTKELAQDWVDNLRGKYADKKGVYKLCEGNGKMCCLGVMADMQQAWSGINPSGNKFILHETYEYDVVPHESCFNDWGLNYDQVDELVALNDSNDTFEPVISKIEEWFIKDK